MIIKNGWLLSLSLLLNACTITLPNTRICAVAGTMSAGADCAYTLDGEPEEMNLDQWVNFLEPQLDPARGAAICMSSADFSKIKTVIEQACKKLGTSCAKEMKEKISRVSAKVDGLQARVMEKRRKLKEKKK